MKCHIFKMLIQRYYDGELSPAEMAEYDNHIIKCEGCGELDRQYVAVFTALEGIEFLEPSPGFDRNVMAQVDISRYRVGVVRKAASALRSAWRGLPSPVRATGYIAAAFALFVAVYSPILSMIASGIRNLIGMVGSGIFLIQTFIKDPSLILNYMSFLEKYHVAWKILVKTVQRHVAGASMLYLILTVIIAGAMLYFVIRKARIAWRKGETHVGII